MTKINTMGTYLAGGIILILMAVSIFPREQYSVYWSCSQRRGNFNYEADRCGEWIY